jgi:hypothetical protein
VREGGKQEGPCRECGECKICFQGCLCKHLHSYRVKSTEKSRVESREDILRKEGRPGGVNLPVNESIELSQKTSEDRDSMAQ